MRIITNNIIDKSTTLTCANESATLPAANLKLEGKTAVLRTGSGSTTLNVTWATDQELGGIAIPWINLDAAANWRIRLYSNTAMTTLLHDSGSIAAGLFAQPGNDGLPENANAFVYGDYGSAAYWLDTQLDNVRGLKIDISNGDRPWIDMSRIIAGKYWQPQYQCDVGAQFGYNDLSATDRNQSGDARIRLGARHRVMRLDLSTMKAADRTALWNCVRSHGAARPLFLSVLPDTAVDADEENMMQLYCKFVQPPALTYTTFNAYASSMEFEEM